MDFLGYIYQRGEWKMFICGIILNTVGWCNSFNLMRRQIYFKFPFVAAEEIIVSEIVKKIKEGIKGSGVACQHYNFLWFYQYGSRYQSFYIIWRPEFCNMVSGDLWKGVNTCSTAYPLFCEKENRVVCNDEGFTIVICLFVFARFKAGLPWLWKYYFFN